MKAVFIFFISLCLFTLTGYELVHAGIDSNSKRSSLAQTQQTAFGQASHNPSSIKSIHLSEKKDDLVIIENEEEDLISTDNEEDTQVYTSKTALQPYFIAATYVAMLNFSASEVKSRLPHCKYWAYTASPKYILQGALRI